MLLAIDIGNTNIVFAVFKGSKMLAKWRAATEAKRTSDEYAIILRDFLGTSDLEFKMIKSAVVSCVVPQIIFEIKKLCKDYFHCTPIIVGEKSVKAEVKISIDNPAEVGADRIVNALSAWKKYKSAAVILDFGTATTFDVIDDRGTYLGGTIAPGINLSIEALQKAAAKLPTITIETASKAIGKNTISAMQAGLFFGYKGLIEGVVDQIKKEYKKKMITIATGGLAPMFAKATKVIDHVEPDLTINGLYEIYELNK